MGKDDSLGSASSSASDSTSRNPRHPPASQTADSRVKRSPKPDADSRLKRRAKPDADSRTKRSAKPEASSGAKRPARRKADSGARRAANSAAGSVESPAASAADGPLAQRPGDPAMLSSERLLCIQRDLARFLAETSELKAALKRIFDTMRELCGAESGGVYVRDENVEGLRLVHHHDLSDTFVKAVELIGPDDSRLEILLRGVAALDVPPDEACVLEGIKFVSVFPVLCQNEVVACVNLGFRREAQVGAETARAAEAIVAQLGGMLTRIRAQEALIHGEQRYRAQFERFPMPAYLWRWDHGEFILCGCNQAAVDETQGKVYDIMGVIASDFYAHRADILESLRQAFEQRTTIQHEIPYRFMHSGEMRLIAVTYTFVPPDLVTVYVDDKTEEHQAATELRAANERLRREQQALEAKNIALQEILSQIEESKARIGESVRANVEHRVMPVVTRLAEETGPGGRQYVQHLQEALEDLTSPFASEMEARFATLTPRELQVCALIRGGAGSKEIARFLAVGAETVRSQRKSIRRKLGIARGKTNLRTFLREFAPARVVPKSDG